MSYTDIDDSSVHFQTAIWTGNGGSDRAIVNDGNSDMQPDWVWYKSRSHATSNILYDSSRGADYYLKSNTDGAEGSDANMFESFDSDGFSLNADSDGNASGRTYVGWQWKANGGTTSTNTDGDINSTVQVNSDAGFSIVTYNPSNTTTRNIGHGLGVKPDCIIIRNRTRVESWRVWFNVIGQGAIMLNSTGTYTVNSNLVNSATTSTFNVGGDFSVNGNYPYVAYCFNNVQGYSKFGKYVGNGASDAAPNTNGPFIYTGFSPALVIIKKTSAVDDWLIFDNKRAGYDPAVYRLYPNSSSAETSGTNNTIQFTSNGFKIRFHGGSLNESGGDYIYMAFASSPFVSSKGIPTTAR